MKKHWIGAAVVLLFFSACSYYTRHAHKLNQYINEGKIQDAYNVVSRDEDKWEKGKDRALYYLNRGALAWMLNKNDESAKYLLKADYYNEDLHKNFSREALSYIINPKVKEYACEDYEAIMIDYYQILNFIQMNDLERAHVQARRLVLQLQKMDDEFKDYQGSDKSNKLQRSAFGHLLLGMVAEMELDYNSAFISYRNALNVYDDDYIRFFGLSAPAQLRKDVLRTAYLAGMDDQVEYYEKKFSVKFDPKTDAQGGNLIFFWNNGLGPVKQEQSANFTVVRGQNGWYTFSNPQYGYTFPVYVGTGSNNNGASFSDIEFVRAAFPIFVERKPYFTNASLSINGLDYNFETAENVNSMAFKTLQDRMLREFGQTLLRLATKKAAEYQLRKENKDAGAALGIVNYITEQADTRNWQSIPHTIYYTRLNLPPGQQVVKMNLRTINNTVDTATFNFNVMPGKTYVQPYQTSQSQYNGYF